MRERTYICEGCFGPMRMSEPDYREQSALGRLVYCLGCRVGGVPPKRVAGSRVMAVRS